MLVVLGGILLIRLPAFLALILGALVVGLLTPDSGLTAFADSKNMSEAATQALLNQTLGAKLAEAFGSTSGKVGILIAMASIIGIALLKSGAAERIIRTLLRWMGVKRIPLAFLSSGFLLAIPVFFDTVFYLMIPLARSMGLRNPARYSLYVLAIVAGAVMAHSLVPPTPGPLFVAGELGVNLGLMIIGGIIVGGIASVAGYLYAVWANRRWPIPVRDSEEAPLAELQTLSEKDTESLPGFGLSVLPIALPVLLIAGNTLLQANIDKSATLSATSQRLLDLFSLVGNSNIALIISAALALLILARQLREPETVKSAIGSALNSAGRIILIIGAGGMFGSILQQTGVGVRIMDLAMTYHVAILPLAFVVTSLMRTAQGSATVAMITAMGMLSSLGDPAALGFHPLYLALAVGCGSKPIPWMNDSGFWIMCKMSGMTETETLKNVSVMMTIMGITGLIVTLLGASLFPLV